MFGFAIQGSTIWPSKPLTELHLGYWVWGECLRFFYIITDWIDSWLLGKWLHFKGLLHVTVMILSKPPTYLTLGYWVLQLNDLLYDCNSNWLWGRHSAKPLTYLTLGYWVLQSNDLLYDCNSHWLWGIHSAKPLIYLTLGYWVLQSNDLLYDCNSHWLWGRHLTKPLTQYPIPHSPLRSDFCPHRARKLTFTLGKGQRKYRHPHSHIHLHERISPDLVEVLRFVNC